MNLKMNKSLAHAYKSKSQIARVLTEHWLENQGYCPNCAGRLSKFANNQPVADFYCANCQEEFELKSKNGNLGKKIRDGAFATMCQRIESTNNPNFFFLSYDNTSWQVKNLLIIPKHFFTLRIIEKSKPLLPTAKRAGWVGCNILIQDIPQSGKIFVIQKTQLVDKAYVQAQWQKIASLRDITLQSRGWLLDVLACVDSIVEREFTLDEVYAFEDTLQKFHPDNRFVRPKIRQQLQVLRDKGFIEFIARGRYRKL